MTPVAWDGDAVVYLDQRALPGEVRYERACDERGLIDAIASLAVRGAPCIGVFAAYGVALLRRTSKDDAAFQISARRLREARPTAVNLAWAVDRVLAAADPLAEARALHAEQRAVDAAIARYGLDLVARGSGILTHCNTGPLATGGEGTALGIVLAAQRGGKKPRVYFGETRPLLQGSRLTATELLDAGVDATLLVDAAVAQAMRAKRVDLVVIGADRIASNGDTANKIGSYGLAILAAHHGIPFYVAAPRSTFDFSIASGADIPIEERDPREVVCIGAAHTAPDGIGVYNPAFDVTPAHLIAGFVTEVGIARPPYGQSLADLPLRPFLTREARTTSHLKPEDDDAT